MLMGNNFSQAAGTITNSIRNILYKLKLSWAKIRFPTADMIIGMGWGKGNYRYLADQEVMDYHTAKKLNPYKYENDEEERILRNIEHYLGKDTRDKMRRDFSSPVYADIQDEIGIGEKQN